MLQAFAAAASQGRFGGPAGDRAPGVQPPALAAPDLPRRLVFLYAPIVILIVFSFNDSRRNIVWRGFTLKYYEKAYNEPSLIEAFINSLTIAFVNTIFSVILGAMVAVALWRFRFPFKAVYEGAMALPIVIPEICMGVAMLAFFTRIGWPSDLPWPLNLGNIIIAHIAFSFPFVAMVVRGAAGQLQPGAGGGRQGPGRQRMADHSGTSWCPFMPGLVAGACSPSPCRWTTS